MQIQTTQLSAARYNSAPKASTQSEACEQVPTDSVSFDSDRFKNSLIITGAGFVPVVGAGTNLMAAWATAWADGDSGGSGVRSSIGLAGTVANVAGTLTGAYGLFSGSHTAKMVGLGLLGASGLAAGTMVALTK